LTNEYPIALDYDRELAAEIGLFLSCYAIIDLYILHIYSLVSEQSKDSANIVLGRIKGNGQRIELIRDLIEISSRPNKSYELELIKQIVMATKRRNEYAHSIYSQVDASPTKWRMSMWLSDGGKRKKEFKDISVSIVKTDCTFIRNTLQLIGGHFGNIAVAYE
jgi:hypothetical protein